MSDPNGLSDIPDADLAAELRRRGLGATVAIGPPMTTEEEAAHKHRLAVTAADEAQAAADAIQAKLNGWKQSLAAAKAEAKRLRAEADKGANG